MTTHMLFVPLLQKQATSHAQKAVNIGSVTSPLVYQTGKSRPFATDALTLRSYVPLGPAPPGLAGGWYSLVKEHSAQVQTTIAA